MRRRPLVIIASIIVTLGLIAGLYFVLFGNSAELTVSNDPFSGLEGGAAGLPSDETSGAGTEVAPRLIRISERAVAEGAAVFTRVSTTTDSIETASGTPALVEVAARDTEVRFIDRASGNIYQYLAGARSLTRISNKTLPGIQRASWLPDGSRAYVQFLTGSEGNEYVATYVLPDSGEGGFFLEQDLAQARAVGSSSLLTLLVGATGSVGSIAKSDGTGARTLFTSPLTSIIVHPSNGGYFANTRPSLFLSGYAFRIEAASGSFVRLLGPLRALSSLPSPDGTKLLYSYVDQGTLRLAVLDTSSRTATALPVATLADKCVWSADSLSVYCGVPTSLSQSLPDSWYQGTYAFSDRIWKINMTDRLATLVVDPSAVADVLIDATALAVDVDQRFLIFSDRRTGSLWSYEL